MNEQPGYMDDLQITEAERIAFLISGYIRQTLTYAEHDELDDWVAASDENMRLFEDLTDENKIQESLDWLDNADAARVLKKLKGRLSFAPDRSFRLFSKFWHYAAAASLVLFAGIALFFLYKDRDTAKPGLPAVAAQTQDVSPGGDKAILTLADGSTIVLEQAKDGTLATQGSSHIIKQNGGLQYNPAAEATSRTPALYNTITTPRGGTYPLTLSDGTRIWLNASSSVQFPVEFTGNERKVAITGEVYFEVAKNAARPFRVEVKDRNMEVEVLGTHFNINAYSDEPSVQTTLLEGSVKVSGAGRQVILKPGQQARLTASDILTINNADTGEIIAWKNGLFQFSDAGITVLMRQLSRWYDIDVSYEGAMPAIRITGKAPRNISLASLLKIIELSGVHYSIEGKKLIVMPY